MLTPKCKEHIQNADTLKQVFEALDNNYHLDKVKLSSMQKNMLLGYFNTAVMLLNPPKK